jgi:hypothetical protein
VGLIYGPETTITINSFFGGHYIGESFAGGVIFYLDESGQHGMVRSMENIGPFLYGCGDIDSHSETSFGSGSQNTANMIGSCSGVNSAASEVLNYSVNGFSDWFLPSKDELELVFQNTILTGISVRIDGLYMTSSQWFGGFYGYMYGGCWELPSYSYTYTANGVWGIYGKGSPTYSDAGYLIPVRIF